ncbi:MAG: hypothetical protein JSS75_01125 [Bacteroidetes bacterium]|nr:hypothetical protein [Bacteroidota bacterium]
MRQRSFIIILTVGVLGWFGCGKSSDSTSSNGTTGGQKHGQGVFLNATHLHAPRSGEHYVLWFKYNGDTGWRSVDTISFSYYLLGDQMTNTSILDSSRTLGDLSEAVISLERTIGTEPTTIVLRGTFSGTDTMRASLDASAIGDFSGMAANLVFTSTLPDPTAYTKEFYLTSYDGAKYLPSLSALPALTSPWKYGLWAVDSNYSPDQLIYYGMFTQASGHDSYPVGDNLAFPGGDGRHAMNVPTGSIIVTLEPDLYGNDVGKLGPTQMTLLRFDRTRKIVRDSNFVMSNVSATTMPTVNIRVFNY